MARVAHASGGRFPQQCLQKYSRQDIQVQPCAFVGPPPQPQYLGLRTHAPTNRLCHRWPRLGSFGRRCGEALQGQERNKSCKADTSAICAAHVCMCSCWMQQHADVACMQGHILLRLPPRKAILCCGRAKAIKNKFVWRTGDRTRV